MTQDDEGWYVFEVPEDLTTNLKTFIKCFSGKDVTLPPAIFGDDDNPAPFSISMVKYRPKNPDEGAKSMGLGKRIFFMCLYVWRGRGEEF